MLLLLLFRFVGLQLFHLRLRLVFSMLLLLLFLFRLVQLQLETANDCLDLVFSQFQLRSGSGHRNFFHLLVDFRLSVNSKIPSLLQPDESGFQLLMFKLYPCREEFMPKGPFRDSRLYLSALRVQDIRASSDLGQLLCQPPVSPQDSSLLLLLGQQLLS